MCKAVLPGPALAAHAAAAVSNKHRAAAEEAITRAVADALHLLGALKQLLPLMAGEPARTAGGVPALWGGGSAAHCATWLRARRGTSCAVMRAPAAQPTLLWPPLLALVPHAQRLPPVPPPARWPPATQAPVCRA